MHAAQNAKSDQIALSRRSLQVEYRPTRKDMLKLLAEGRQKLDVDAVCTGQCVYCDGDDGGDA